MANPNPVDLEKAARDAVSTRLAKAQNAASQAGDIAREMVVSAVAGTGKAQAPASVRAICRGVLSGMMFLSKDVPATAIQILKKTGTAAEGAGIEPGELMTWAMEGMAGLAPAMGMEVAGEIGQRIDQEFMGAGGIFGDLCEKARKAPPQ